MPVADLDGGLLPDEQRNCRKAESFFEGIFDTVTMEISVEQCDRLPHDEKLGNPDRSCRSFSLKGMSSCDKVQ